LTAAVARRGIDVEGLRSEQGQTLVEFALILPLLLLLVLGIFEFALAFNTKNDLNFLANTAARYAEVNACGGCPSNGSDTIADYVENTANTGKLASPPQITFTLLPGPSGSSGAVGDPLKVTACADFSYLGGVSLPGMPSGTITLWSTATVRILQPYDNSLYHNTPPCHS